MIMPKETAEKVRKMIIETCRRIDEIVAAPRKEEA